MEGRRIRDAWAGLIAVSVALLPATGFGQAPPNLGHDGVQPPVLISPDQPAGDMPDHPGAAVPEETEAPVVPAHQGHVRDVVRRMWGYVDPDNAEIISVHQLACLIDDLDKSLHCRGQVVVKGPDVWGQNRLTAFRSEYEDQMRTQLGNFEIILNSYQRRADLAALTSATSVGASVGPQISNSRNITSTTNVSPSPAIPSAAGLVGTNGLVANANSLIGTMSPLLMPSNLTSLALANKGAAQGLGIEPTILLDERSRFLNHLHELRRINMGDDRTDMPGYSLYLVRMPVSVLPGDDSIKGKGALVTVQAKHHVTPDVLANTVRQCAIIDTTYQLMDIIVRGQYQDIQDDVCTKGYTPERPPDRPTAEPYKDTTPPLQPPTGPDTKTSEGAASPLPSSTRDPEVRTSAINLPTPEPSVWGRAGASVAARPGSIAGSNGAAVGSPPASELVALYGAENLRILVCSFRGDEQLWFRHDPTVVNWLITELSAAYGYIREQAHLGNPLFQRECFESLGSLAIMRDYEALKVHRDRWLSEVARRGWPKSGGAGRPPVDPHVGHSSMAFQDDGAHPAGAPQIRPIDIFAYMLILQSMFIDRQIKYDMYVQMQRKGCPLGDPEQYGFYYPWPDPASARAFAAYVECKWPLHVYSLDPVVDQQNQLDLYSERTELQLALATAIATGQASFENATTYARRLEQDLAAINLNRTAVGFGAGERTFGWRLRPRIQTPPTQGNPRRILGILANNGPGPDYALKNAQIEPGLRECYALMVVPNFVPMIRLTTITNWFDLKTCHPDQELETTDMIRLGRKLQVARDAMQRLCDSGRYRPVDLELLHDRLDQLEALLPMQSHQVMLPFEADLTGGAIFTSANSGLAPRLLMWSGAPGEAGGSVFLTGTGFNIHDLKVIVGGVTLKDPYVAPKPDEPPTAPGEPKTPTYELISRNVLRIDIPKNARLIRTPIVFQDPSIRSFDPRLCYDCNNAPDPVRTAAEVRAEKARQAASAWNAAAAHNQDPHAHDKKPTSPLDCLWKQRWVIDVHVATSNGVSNHLLIEVPDGCVAAKEDPKLVSTTVTTITKPNPADGSTTTTTQFQTTPPGIVLPPGTYLPMGAGLPPGGTLVAPGAASFQNGAPGFLPGTVPSTWYPPLPAPKATGDQGALDAAPGDPMALAPHPADAPRANPTDDTGARMASALRADGPQVGAPAAIGGPAGTAPRPVGTRVPPAEDGLPHPADSGRAAGIPSSPPARRQSAAWPGAGTRPWPSAASSVSHNDPDVVPASAVAPGGARTRSAKNLAASPAPRPAGASPPRKSLLHRVLGRNR